ncbi:MAG: hypothetical protein LBK01_06230 [Burkholderiaceae bacterium]|jgi:hypothetical protein|nr:hypothetical protein [Burkholderiaceae bacterium]
MPDDKMIQCKRCDKAFSSTQKNCPHCNAPASNKLAKRLMWVLGITFLGLSAAIGWGIYQRTQEKVRTLQEIRTERRNEKILQRAMAATAFLKGRLENTASGKKTATASIDADKIQTNEDGSILCFHYRITTPDGESKAGKAVFAEMDIHNTDADWALYCSGKKLTALPEKRAESD